MPTKTRKPRSEAQRQASRRNGRRSKGPTSAAGKARSCMNAVSHGITARTLVLISRYEPSLQRAFKLAFETLEKIQANRPDPELGTGQPVPSEPGERVDWPACPPSSQNEPENPPQVQPDQRVDTPSDPEPQPERHASEVGEREVSPTSSPSPQNEPENPTQPSLNQSFDSPSCPEPQPERLPDACPPPAPADVLAPE